MSNYLLEHLNKLITDDQINLISQKMGENNQSVSKALSGIFPTIIEGILQSPNSNHSKIAEILSKAVQSENGVNAFLNDQGTSDVDPAWLGNGTALLQGVFGDKVNGVSNLISNFAGVQSNTSSSLLGMSASLIASFLGKKMQEDGLLFGGLLNWMREHKHEIQAYVPAGLANYLSPALASQASAPRMPIQSEEKKSGMKWVLPIILLGLFGFGIFYWMKGFNHDENPQGPYQKDSTEISIDAAATDAANALSAVSDSGQSNGTEDTKGKLDEAGNWIVPKGDPIKIKLDDGFEIETFKGSLEDKLYSFIKDPGAKPSKELWFNFEDVLFESGKATLRPGSTRQIDNVVHILKVFTNVKVKLGGYTDNTGDSVKNVKLSVARAKKVYEQMIQSGLTAASFDDKPFEGYGPQYPVADNSTPEGRGQNRRISLSPRAK